MTITELENGGVIRRLMRGCTRVGLGTLATGGDPYVSLATVAVDHDAAPLLYLSDLADHTKNLKLDPRVSLLFDGTLASAVPLAGERATVQGRIERATEPRLLARYVARHPDAAAYTGFRDFNLYRVTVERAHLVAGFGRIHWVDGKAVTLAVGDIGTLPEQEAAMVAHMNATTAMPSSSTPPGSWGAPAATGRSLAWTPRVATCGRAPRRPDCGSISRPKTPRARAWSWSASSVAPVQKPRAPECLFSWGKYQSEHGRQR